MILQHIRKLELKICTPHSSVSPDPDERQELLIRNKWQFRFYFGLFVVFLSLFNVIQADQASKWFFMGFVFLHTTAFACLCRSRLYIYRWFYAITSTFGEFGLVIFMKESIIHAIIISLVAPLFVMTITTDIYCVGFNAIGQLFLMHVVYKPFLEDFIKHLPPIEFTNKFIDAASLIMLAILILYGIIFFTLKNTSRELKESKKRAEEACARLQLFLQTFSHELRNPLNSLLGNIHLALQESSQAKAVEMMESAKICGELLLQLINNILDTGKLQVGTLEVSPTESNIIEIIGGVWRISRDVIRKKNLNGFLKIDRTLPPILWLDYYRINQILFNLIGNSIKFTQEGQICVSFQWLSNSVISESNFLPAPYDDENEGIFEKNQNTRAISPNDDMSDYFVYVNSKWNDLSNLNLSCRDPKAPGVLKIMVKDTGCGMAQGEVDQVFEKFTQFHKDSVRRSAGTGLGLNIAREICEKMGGEIKAYSKVNVGTTFIVCIPTYCPASVQEAPLFDNVIMSLRALRLKTIIIDDNAFNLDLIANYIRKLNGLAVNKAQNGADGYNKYVEYRNQNRNVDIVFLDIDMPILNGKFTCMKIREYEKAQNLRPTKIVFVSGDHSDSQIQELLSKSGKYRADGFLKKPVKYENFIRKIGHIMLPPEQSISYGLQHSKR